ncbi:MAG: YidC/Oxa1 family membrane protein insertase [Gemmiger sp.]
MSVFGFLAYIMGPLMKLMYQVIPSYAVTIIVFTILIRLLSFPLAIHQQKSMAKMSVFTPMINEIQQKYKNNQQKQQEELMRLQEEYGYNPTAGCMPMLLNMLVLFGIIEVVYKPLKYILSIPTAAIETACEALGLNAANYVSQTQLIQAIHAGTTVETGLTAEQIASIQGFNTQFLGMDICAVPGLQLSPLLIFPILATITMIISQIISNRMSGQQAQQQTSMKVMMWAMNAFFAYFCFTVPVGFSLYYTVSNLCMLVQSLITGKLYSPEKYKAQYEEEVAAKKAERKKKRAVTVEVNGKEVEKEVGLADYNKIRLERARALDAEKYRDERTTPLNRDE